MYVRLWRSLLGKEPGPCHAKSTPLNSVSRIESFNRTLRDEVLNREVFDTVWEAKVLVERWRREYNQTRLHSALGFRPPAPEAVCPTDMGLPLVVGSARFRLPTTVN